VSRASLLRYCLAKPGAWLDEPWEGDEVVKVGDKIFAFFGAPDNSSVGLKCGRNQEESREWRDQYPDDVTISAYIGRYGWNSFVIGGAVSDDELLEVVDLSYADVVARLPKSKRPG
jgi:predicted DNA-binding protein (MmcQ/YjbR family)